MAKVILTGTPGCGKTTLISRLKHIRVYNMGTEMMKYTTHKVERDKIRALSPQELKDLRKKVFAEINSIKEDLIIDTHTSVKSGNRYVAGLSADDLHVLKDVKAIIYLDAPAVDILLRRVKDHTRKREDESADDIDEQRDVNISFATYYSQELGAPLYIIKNRNNMLDQARTEVEQAIHDSLATK